MLHQVVIIENILTFATAVPILFVSVVYRTNVHWSVIHGIKRKPHLSVVWNWYHFAAIAILHQPRPTVSADINTRLQLSDTSSIPPMHGGLLLVSLNRIMIGLGKVYRLLGTKPCLNQWCVIIVRATVEKRQPHQRKVRRHLQTTGSTFTNKD